MRWEDRRTAGIGVATVALAVLAFTGIATAGDRDDAGPENDAQPRGKDDEVLVPPPPGRAATPEDPLRVVILGDSVAQDSAVGLQAALESTGAVAVESQFPITFGLTRPYDWRTEFGGLVREQGTEVAVLFLGGSWDQPSAIADTEAYRGIVQEAVDVLGSTGGHVVIIGAPPTYEDLLPELNRDVMNEVYASMERLRPGVASYLDPDPALAASPTGEGGFVEHLPTADGRIARIRKSNAHVCPEGAARLGNDLRQAIAEINPLPAPDPTWYWGGWRSSFLYTSSPPGACDF
ncbi:MAG: SGNH hydrolase domain-containing protein [Acidimicrobiia bacterium]